MEVLAFLMTYLYVNCILLKVFIMEYSTSKKEERLV